MNIVDNKENICVRCDLPKGGQKVDNNNIVAEHANGDVSLPEGRSPGDRRPAEDADSAALRCRIRSQDDEKVGESVPIPSEDEISSNSDDCVYTYRGGVEAPMRVTQEVDDTDFLDFLEMDFDPEPSSEQDIYQENSYFPELDGFIANLQAENSLNFNGFLDKALTPPKPSDTSGDKAQRNTGAKPKVVQANPPPVRQKKSPPSVPPPEPQQRVIERQREVCLECTEMEFLSETSQNPNKQNRKCTKHAQECPTTKIQPGPLPWDAVLQNVPPVGMTIPPCESRQLLTLNLPTDKVVKINSVGATEEDVTECLSTLGIQVDSVKLHEALKPPEEPPKHLMDFLIHISKSQCDYRKLIDAIRAASDAKDLQFRFEPSQTVPEMIRVNLTDIASRWDPNTSLRDLMNLPNKYFHTYNVVGKIANAIRQLTTQRGGERRDHILIPNFYRSGLVVISLRK